MVHLFHYYVIFLIVVESEHIPGFEKFLLKEQLQRSRYHLGNGDTSSEKNHSPNQKQGISRSMFQKTAVERNLFQEVSSPNVLAIIHSSEIPWPARVEVLSNVLITLEGSYDVSKKRDGFDLTVILDSKGQVMSRHKCRENHVTMMRTHILSDNREVCDSKQLLEGSSIPFVVAESTKSKSHGDHLRHRRLHSPHVHPAPAQRQYQSVVPGSKWPSSSYRSMWYAALSHCRQVKCENLITLISSTLIPRGTINALIVAAAHHGGAILPIFDSRAVEEKTAAGVQLSLSSHLAEAPTYLNPDSKEALGPFMEHPLNYERVARAIRGTTHQRSSTLVRRIEKEPLWCEYADALTLAAAMPRGVWEKLASSASHVFGTVKLDDCEALQSALSGSLLGIHEGAYLVARPPHNGASLLSNALDPIYSSRLNRQFEEKEPQQKKIRSKTLVTVTCAGVWHRTLSMILSLEMSEGLIHPKDTNPSNKFDFMVAVTPRDDDTTAQFVNIAGIDTLVQPRAIGLTNLWNLVLQHCVGNGYEFCLISNNDILVGSTTIGALVSPLSHFDLVLPYTKKGAGTVDLGQYTKGYNTDQYLRETDALDPLDSFFEAPLSWQRIQTSVQHQHDVLRIKSWMAFCFGLRADWIQRNFLEDGSQRLWNDTRWKNYAQEKHLPEGARMAAVKGAYVHHFRGGTLDSASCKNGWLDCATWQENHRPDMESEWWTPQTSWEGGPKLGGR